MTGCSTWPSEKVAVLDRTWLESLRFETIGGFSVTKLLGIGSEMITFEVASRDSGEQQVLQTRQNHLAYHIKEIPPFLTDTPQYSVSRVNQKLTQIIGDPLADSMFNDYDRLHQSILSFCYRMRDKDPIPQIPAMPFPWNEIGGILKSPPMRRRLEAIATLGRSASIQDAFVSVSGPDFRIDGPRDELIDWARTALQEIDQLSPTGDLEFESIFGNHLVIWAGAAAEGFFVDEELPEAVAFVERQFGRLPDRKDVCTLITHLSILASLMNCLIEKPKLDRFARFCKEAGAMFPIVGKHGSVSYPV